MTKNNKIIRINDKVKIINPETIIRCGYPLNKQIVKDTILTQDQKECIYYMLAKFRGKSVLLSQEEIYDETYDKILDLMAYEVLSQKEFGGQDRQLFTINRESLRNKLGWVNGRKVVKTGKRHCGGSSLYGYDGDYEYESAYLENEKTHVLYKLAFYLKQDLCPNINDEGIWIERQNLEKINE